LPFIACKKRLYGFEHLWNRAAVVHGKWLIQAGINANVVVRAGDQPRSEIINLTGAVENRPDCPPSSFARHLEANREEGVLRSS